MWQPYKKIILEGGDEYAYHSGGKGGVCLTSTLQDPQEIGQDIPILSDALQDALDEFFNNLDS